ncbi:MAG TPA: molybdopterin-dependent oxidoreductase [Gammaproteobacteria bacterium]|nr:molybdopterin-dependent oxidoreductase [Gammaproteobacteria bacterium]
MPDIDRRDFLKLVGAGSVGVAAGFVLAESIKHPVEYLIPFPVPPEDYSPGIATWYNTVCRMCAAGCGISVRTREGRAKKIEGNPAHPVNQGRLCALGQAGLQVLYNPDRLTTPLLRDGDRTGPFTQITWEEGLSAVADRLASVDGGRIYLLSEGVRGHLAGLFELFMAGLGSNRLLHYDFDYPHTLYAANKRFYGENNLPYYDLRNARYLLSFGADYLGSWISPVHHGLGFGHSRQGGEVRGYFVQIEPRMSLSGAAADEWIAASPGTEGLLALGLAHHIVAEGLYEGDDRDDWMSALAAYSTARVAEQTDVPTNTIARLAKAFARNQPSLAIGGGAAGNHSGGVDTLVAVNALNYLVGNLGKSGGLLFNPDPVVGRPTRSRRASFQTMLELAEDARRGNIEVLIVNQTNPVFTLPAATGFKEALAGIPLIVSLSSFMDETTALADLILPSHTYLESWGDDIPEPGVGFRTASVSQPVVSPLYDTRATGDIVLGLAQKLGLTDSMPWTSMKEYVEQGWRQIHARGADTETRDFQAFWRAILQAGVWGEKLRRDNGAFALDKSVIDNIGAQQPEFSGSNDDFPFVLHPYLSNTFLDGRGANLPWMQELPDPMTSVVYGSWVELNPATARQLGLAQGDLVRVESPHGSVSAPVYLYPGIRPDVIAMPIGQGHAEYGRYARNRGSNPIEILAPRAESHTGALAWSATRVKLAATGKKAALVQTGGTSRQLGRGIVQTTDATAGSGHNARLNSIPIKVVST